MGTLRFTFLTTPYHLTGLMWISWLVAVSCAFSAAAQQKTYIGAETCGTCHKTQWVGQSASGHARALYPVSSHPLTAFFVPDKTFRREPHFSLQFLRSGKEIRVRALDNSVPDKPTLELPLEWAVGSGDTGVTFLTWMTHDHKKAIAPYLAGAMDPRSGELHPKLANRDYYMEFAVSYYSDTGSLHLTPGHKFKVDALPKALGQLEAASEEEGCFPCHSTGPLSRLPTGALQPSELGVRCEVCHGPGSAHMEAVLQGEEERARKLIDNPNRLSPEELNKMCGTCHRTGKEWTEADWKIPFSVRHQPPYLSRSQCFQKSNETLSCLTCHDLHEGVRRNQPAYYNQRCTTCHNDENNPPMSICEERQPADCIRCHMPVLFEASHTPFHNHWIGIYRDGASLRPSR